MLLISYKDWIAGKHHLRGKAKELQEDILSDDQFPDSVHNDEMLQYLKQKNASTLIIKIFNESFYHQYKRQVLDACRGNRSYNNKMKVR